MLFRSQYEKFGQPYESGTSGPNDGFVATDALNNFGNTTTTPKSIQPRLFSDQQGLVSTTSQTSNATNPSADVLANQVNQNAVVAPDATVPNELLNTRTTSTNTPGTSSNNSMLFGTATYEGTTSGPTPNISTGAGGTQTQTQTQTTTTTPTGTTTTSSTITEQSIINVGGEPYIPGQQLSQRQLNAVAMSIQMSNPASPLVLAQYNKQTQTTN